MVRLPTRREARSIAVVCAAAGMLYLVVLLVARLTWPTMSPALFLLDLGPLLGTALVLLIGQVGDRT